MFPHYDLYDRQHLPPHRCEGGRADILTVRRDWRGPLASERATAEEQFITHLRGDVMKIRLPEPIARTNYIYNHIYIYIL